MASGAPHDLSVHPLPPSRSSLPCQPASTVSLQMWQACFLARAFAAHVGPPEMSSPEPWTGTHMAVWGPSVMTGHLYKRQAGWPGRE